MKNKTNIFLNINSVYILKNIFSVPGKMISLDIISHNKKMQNKLEITIEDYKKQSGKYIIKDKDPFDLLSKEDIYKAYSIEGNVLLFEGKYVNGKKDGRGKEYYNDGKLKFYGDYLNGKRISGRFYDKLENIFLEIDNKKVKELYKNGATKFVGEYFNEKKWNGIGYDINGYQVFKIAYGIGEVKEFFDDGKLKFEGHYYNGERNGKGKRYDYEGEVLFEGEYLNGERWNGTGKEYYCDLDEKRKEQNKFNFNFFNENKKKKKYNFGLAGAISDLFGLGDEREEKNNFFGNMWVSPFKNKNIMRLTDNFLGHKIERKVLKYEGGYINGKRHGKGKEFNTKEKLIYEGNYSNGYWDGEGKEYVMDIFGNLSELKYEGEFKNGKYNGKGKLYETGSITPSDEPQFEGEFKDGKYIGK